MDVDDSDAMYTARHGQHRISPGEDPLSEAHKMRSTALTSTTPIQCTTDPAIDVTMIRSDAPAHTYTCHPVGTGDG